MVGNFRTARKNIIILIFIFYILTSGCITSDHRDRNPRSMYHVKISNVASNYTIVIPLPVNNEGHINEITKNIGFIKGDGEFEIIKTSYGLDRLGLKITSNQEIELKAISAKGPLFRLSLSNTSEYFYTWEEAAPNWYVFLELNSSDDPIEIYIRYEFERGSKMDGFLIKGEVLNGLHLMKGKKLKMTD